MAVIHSISLLSRNVGPTINAHDEWEVFNWVAGNAEGVNYIVESNDGKGIDVWFKLKLTRSRGYLLVGDQRR